MTREEAIARIKDHKIIHKMYEPRAIHISEALDMAISALSKTPSETEIRTEESKDGDLISRTDLLNKIWQKVYGKDYDGVNMLNIPHIDIIENMPSYNSIKTELSGDLIPRQAVIKMLNKIENAVEDGDGFQFNEWIYYAKHIPSAEKNAEWLIDEHIDENTYCSNCGFYRLSEYVKGFKYCPNCGAKMKGEKDDL